MKKRLITLLLISAMVLGLAACGGTDKSGAKTTEPAKSTEPAAEKTGITAENIKVGFVHISDASDMGYTYNHDLGTKKMQENLGLKDEQIINKYNVSESSECDTAIRELVEAGCNIIFCTSFGFEDYMLAVAEEYPDVQFCQATGNKAASSGLKNVHNYFTSIYEARYLTGIAAGLKTKTNKLGYVAAYPYAEVISGYTAFYLGAKSVNPNVTMDVMYTNSWNDPTTESKVAQALIDGGCDVIGQHSDSTATATTAEANGVWQVGYNADMIEAAPKASLISARSDWSIYLTYAVQSVINGENIDVDWCKGSADGAVYLSPLNTAIAAEGTQQAIDKALVGIKDGTLNVFEGPLYDVDGKEVVAAGDHYAESSKISAPSWAYILKGINILG